MKRLILYLIVILNPYNDIIYEDLLVVDIQPSTELEVVEVLGDGYREEMKEDEVCFPREGLDYSLRQYFVNFPL